MRILNLCIVLFVFLIGCDNETHHEPELIQKFVLGGSCGDTTPFTPFFIPDDRIYDQRNYGVGSVHLEFYEDSTYSIRYKFGIYDRNNDQVTIYERDEIGEFSFTNPSSSQASIYTSGGTITFYPEGGESWSASYTLGLMYAMVIRLENGSVVISFSGCYDYIYVEKE